MDKYAVITDDDKTKTASKDTTCPKCGSKLSEETNVPSCPNCGTRPFESSGKTNG